SGRFFSSAIVRTAKANCLISSSIFFLFSSKKSDLLAGSLLVILAKIVKNVNPPHHDRMGFMAKGVPRLHDQFQPNHYILNLTLDKSKKVFSGYVIVAGQKVGRPNKRITFHQNGLK